jgi:hypothetical protein
VQQDQQWRRIVTPDAYMQAAAADLRNSERQGFMLHFISAVEAH